MRIIDLLYLKDLSLMRLKKHTSHFRILCLVDFIVGLRCNEIHPILVLLLD